MKDAIGLNRCDTCIYFHNPSQQAIGCCIRNPPTPFIVGMSGGGPLIDPTKPQQVEPIVRAFFPVVGKNDGCGRHTSVNQPKADQRH